MVDQTLAQLADSLPTPIKGAIRDIISALSDAYNLGVEDTRQALAGPLRFR